MRWIVWGGLLLYAGMVAFDLWMRAREKKADYKGDGFPFGDV